MVPLLRAILGQLILATPVVVWLSLRTAVSRRRADRTKVVGAALGIFAFWPLFAVIEAASFGKQTLPHWILPAFWMILPAAALEAGRALELSRNMQRFYSWNARVAAAVTWLLPWALAVPAWRGEILSQMGGRPGPLAELTLWPELARSLAEDPKILAVRAAVAKDRQAKIFCHGVPEIVSVRWFWSAQMAFHLPGEPRVGSLEPEKLSFYRFRDENLAARARGCATLLVADARHVDEETLRRHADIEPPFRLAVFGHDDVPVIAAFARIRNWPIVPKALRGVQAAGPGDAGSEAP